MKSNDLIDVFNDTLQAGRLTTTQLTGALRLIVYKKAGGNERLMNWRLFTLLTSIKKYWQ